MPALIGIDWGSSNLRVALLDIEGRLIDRRESAAGVFTIRDGTFAAALWPLCADWIAQDDLPLLACGMIGSKQGLVEVPYVSCPARIDDVARALGSIDIEPPTLSTTGAKVTLQIVPGLQTGSRVAGHDVMRGEETQLFGVDAQPFDLFVLPGTHSKWVAMGHAERVESFQTYMTGEMFELLRTHGSLARVMAPAQWSPLAFEHGVIEAREGALENLLFRVRTAGLMGRFQPAELADYLSGLMIGAELKAGLHKFAAAGVREISLLGTAQLTRRYTLAFAAFGCPVQELPGDAVFSGLMAIARRAKLLGRGKGQQHP